MVEHELNAAGDFVRLVFEPSRGASRDCGVEDEETTEFDGGVFVVVGGPVACEQVFGIRLKGDEHFADGGVLESLDEIWGDFLGDEEGGELKN